MDRGGAPVHGDVLPRLGVAMKTAEERITRLEAQIQSQEMQMLDMAERIGELEQAVFLAEDAPIDEVDELEAAHMQFAGLVRARREGSA